MGPRLATAVPLMLPSRSVIAAGRRTWRGTLCANGGESHLYSGNLPWSDGYPSPHIQAPLQDRFVRLTDIGQRAREILALTKMNLELQGAPRPARRR